MSNLPKYHFGDIPAEITGEIMNEMLAAKPEPRLENVEDVNRWFNYRNSRRTIPGWYPTIGEFLSDVRAEYR